jgi:hypothetical protein
MAWVSVNVDPRQLPELDEPVFLIDKSSGYKWIGCRSFVSDADGWVWCNSHGLVWSKGNGWDCESEWDDEYTPTHFHRFPSSL